MSSATYRTLLRAPGAAAFFLTAAVGRVGIAMTSLGIVWLVHARTGSYATAGLVTGGFAVAEAVAGPQLARLIDRFGQTRVLPPVLLAHAAAVAALLALVAAGTPDWLMTAGGVLAGATIPQLGALSAARWAALLRDERAAALPTAFALESVVNELAYLAGPVLVSILGTSGYPAAGTILAAALVVAGGLCFAAQRRTAPPASGAAERHRGGRWLVRPGFAVLAGVTLALGGFFGAMPIAVTAFAVEHGAPGAAAALFLVSSCASLLAGVLYGQRRWRTPPRVQLAVATAGLAVGCLPLLVAGSPLELGCCVALTGLAVPPVYVLCSVLAESAVHRAVLTQAFAWLNSASAAGSAGAAAAAGWAVDAFGAHGGFAVAAVAAGVMVLLAVTGLRALRVPPRHEQEQRPTRQSRSPSGPGAELVRVADDPDVLDVVAGDLEREHRHDAAVLLGHQAGLAVDRAFQEPHARRRPAGDLDPRAGDPLAAGDGVDEGDGPPAAVGDRGGIRVEQPNESVDILRLPGKPEGPDDRGLPGGRARRGRLRRADTAAGGGGRAGGTPRGCARRCRPPRRTGSGRRRAR